MDFLVLSDSHGKRHALRRVAEQINFRPSGILFLGDGVRDLSVFDECEALSGVPVYAVSGNCDVLSFFDGDFPDVRIELLGGKRAVLMHGHTHYVKSGLGAAIQYAATVGADILFYGHTHVPYEQTLPAGQSVGAGMVLTKPLLVANPGSIGEPRGEGGSFGVLSVQNGQMLFSHGTLN